MKTLVLRKLAVTNLGPQHIPAEDRTTVYPVVDLGLLEWTLMRPLGDSRAWLRVRADGGDVDGIAVVTDQEPATRKALEKIRRGFPRRLSPGRVYARPAAAVEKTVLTSPPAPAAAPTPDEGRRVVVARVRSTYTLEFVEVPQSADGDLDFDEERVVGSRALEECYAVFGDPVAPDDRGLRAWMDAREEQASKSVSDLVNYGRPM